MLEMLARPPIALLPASLSLAASAFSRPEEPGPRAPARERNAAAQNRAHSKRRAPTVAGSAPLATIQGWRSRIGNLGELARTLLAKPLSDAAWGPTKREIGYQPVETVFGFSIIKRTE